MAIAWAHLFWAIALKINPKIGVPEIGEEQFSRSQLARVPRNLPPANQLRPSFPKGIFPIYQHSEKPQHHSEPVPLGALRSSYQCGGTPLVPPPNEHQVGQSGSMYPRLH